MRIRTSKTGRVDCVATLPIPLSAPRVWGQLRDFDKFARQEFFHATVRVEGDFARQGAQIELIHRFFIFSTRRVGRICLWKEGEGFAFSDLNPNNPGRRFPHVFGYRIKPISPESCTLSVYVSGKWTATIVPRPFVRLWLWWIMRFATQNVRNEFLMYQLWIAKNLPRKQGVR